ncbi:selenocysteine-specific translation elongation factor [Microlunatus endophyticus]|uniref:Selenocysteine-specific translation elongation factor n=1 Tax=Microlunatus endophyticus TaxID=1716077 RepID=A0A917W1Q2_9ACTN|nr:selenocysteine-specific translation elongation factor [Microlunatus endophyticus]GGL52236.1 selenocysteine-specific translation elongation factor [Microlunatus endophyticus]
MHVIATAGHVDHGKSTLVRALTGMEPDRFAEEKRRGLTIELGYAWTTLPGPDAPADPVLAFVDVPGHERFIATMLAGLGPSPAVMFVVAADEGWRQQSTEHLAAVDALGLTHGILVVTRSDRADPGPATIEAVARLADSSLGQVPAIAVSGLTGDGLPRLRQALADLVRTLPDPVTDGRIRLWVDRSFTIRGAGTVITGTLGAGTLGIGDELQLDDRRTRIRGLQALGRDHDQVSAVARVAVNLRGVGPDDIGRGNALITPDAWYSAAVADVRVRPVGRSVDDLPAQLVAHLGTAAIPVRLRPLGGPMVRLTLSRAVPLTPGDRLVLRDPGRHAVAAGAIVLDVDPPELRRRGAARQRAADLVRREHVSVTEILADEVRRRGPVRRSDLQVRGIGIDGRADLVSIDDWLIDPQTFGDRGRALAAAVDDRANAAPLDPRLSIEGARRAAGLPDRRLVAPVAAAAGLVIVDGSVERPQTGDDLGAAEPGLRTLTEHLTAAPYAAPERPQLDEWGLGMRELAAAERAGRIVRLAEDIVLLPTGPALAMRTLAALPQPFTTSAARQALGSTRRVIIPLLESLDRRGWTIRVDADHRRVRTGGTSRAD